jgi:hypothetical protein
MLFDIHTRHTEMIAMMRKFAPPQQPRRRIDQALKLQGNLFGEL